MKEDMLNRYLSHVQQERINVDRIESMTKSLINMQNQTVYVNPKFSIITALALFFIVGALGIINYSIKQDNLTALESQQQEKRSMLNTEYIYATMMSTYGE